MKKKYSLSVIGAGVGGTLSMQGSSDIGQYELTAVSDLRQDVLDEKKKEFPGIKTFTNHKTMLAKCPTDVVCISTYAPTHLPIVRDVLDMPDLCGILVEKPLGENATAGKEIIRLIKSEKLPMIVPHGTLWASHCKSAMEDVCAGKIGKLELIEIQCAKWDIINAGIHWLNYFVALTGNAPVDFVMSQCDETTRTFRDGMQVETQAIVYVQTKNGVRCLLQTGDDIHLQDEDTTFRLVGTEGVINFQRYGKSQYTIINRDHPGGEVINVKDNKEKGHTSPLRDLLAMMEAGKPDYTVADSSLLAQEIVDAAYLSNRESCLVRFPLDRFSVPEKTDWDPGMPYDGKGGGRDGRKLPS